MWNCNKTVLKSGGKQFKTPHWKDYDNRREPTLCAMTTPHSLVLNFTVKLTIIDRSISCHN
jgi:hypothetical protein